MDFTIPPELNELRLLTRRFVERELMPLEQEVEETDDFPDDNRCALQRRAAGLGLWALNIPEEFGGGGVNSLGALLVHIEVGKTSMALGHHVVNGPPFILLHGSQEIKERFLLPGVRAEKIACLALTEPNAGSDAASIQTRAVADGDDFVINGRKHFITNGDKADYAIVFAVTEPGRRHKGISCLLVEKGTPGFSVGRIQETMGIRGLHQVELVFEDCRIPRARLLGNLNEGFTLAMQMLGQTRLIISAHNLGKAERIQSLATEYAKKRITFGQPIAERQAVQWMLADSAVEIYASRMMAYNVAWEIDQGVRDGAHTSMLKLFVSEMVNRVADRAMQIFGGMGYTKELPIERFYRDVRVERIWEGPSEIHRMLIARDLLRG